jgi:hypothetical protein
MRELTVRKKMLIAFVIAAAALVAAIKLLSPMAAHKGPLFGTIVVIVGGLFVYASSLKCPHCHGRAFSRRWLMLAYIPQTCARCDRDLFLD